MAIRLWKHSGVKNNVIQHIKQLFVSYPEITHCILSSVGSLPSQAITLLEELASVHVLSYLSKIPLQTPIKHQKH